MNEWDGKTERRKNGVNHLREVVQIKLESAERALTLQAKEYERRLDALNGEAERLRQMQASYVSKEVYMVEHKSLLVKTEALEKLVYIGLGLVLALQFLLHYWK